MYLTKEYKMYVTKNMTGLESACKHTYVTKYKTSLALASWGVCKRDIYTYKRDLQTCTKKSIKMTYNDMLYREYDGLGSCTATRV